MYALIFISVWNDNMAFDMIFEGDGFNLQQTFVLELKQVFFFSLTRNKSRLWKQQLFIICILYWL